MNAIAPLRLLPAQGCIFQPRDVTAIGLVINRLADREAGPQLDADIFRAMGWHVTEPATPRASWLARSPFARHWMPLPPVSTISDASAILRRPGWDYGCAHIGGHGRGWTRHPQIEALYFEQNGGTRAQALARALLFSHRHRLMTGDPS